MNIRRATAERLLSVPALRDIIEDRVYYWRLPKELKPPHVIIWRLEDKRIYDHDGYSGLSEALLQVSCFSYDSDEVDAIAEIILASLEAWAAECEDIDSVLQEDAADLYEEAAQIYHVSGDYRISYHE